MNSYEVLRKAVLGVEDNNKINGDSWQNWNTVSDILSVYDLPEDDLTDDHYDILESFIENNRASGEKMTDALEEEYGVRFNTWDYLDQ